MRRAFSLVELSIVLVILGLLVGGILAGQSLIRAAELRAVSSEYQRYMTAVYSFRDKYFGLPGDITNATMIWGKDNTNCAAHTGTNATPGTCNGDGNGLVTPPAAANQTGEYFQFWKQLALAGMVEGAYTGLAGAGSLSDANIGVNVPASRLSGGGFSIGALGYVAAGDASWFEGRYGTFFFFGGNTAADMNAPILKTEESWNIDTKLDDGKPGLGVVRTQESMTSCNTTTVAATAAYKLDDNAANLCALLFVPGL